MIDEELRKIIVDNINLPIKVFVDNNQIADGYCDTAQEIVVAEIKTMALYDDRWASKQEIYDQMFDECIIDKDPSMSESNFENSVWDKVNKLDFKKYLVIYTQ